MLLTLDLHTECLSVHEGDSKFLVLVLLTLDLHTECLSVHEGDSKFLETNIY